MTSHLEETFDLTLKDEGIGGYEREHRFDPERRWRLDFAWPELMLAVEVEGGIWMYGRHNRGSGYLRDLEKYNRAAELGWTVLRFASSHVNEGGGIRLLKAMIESRNKTK